MQPEPKPLALVCTVCGMPWEAHGETPTIERCVELLMLEVARLKVPVPAPWGAIPYVPTPPTVAPFTFTRESKIVYCAAAA